MEWRETIIILGINIRSVFYQQVNKFVLVTNNCVHKRGAAITVFGIKINAFVQ